MSKNNSETRCGFAAVLGLPNAGKSTLINLMVGEKVSIVSRKAQTTRMQIRGIVLEGQSQIVLIDTPGIFQGKRTLDRSMVEAAWAGLDDSDICILIVDVSQKECVEDQKPLLERINQTGKLKWLVLNKIDRIKKDKLLEITAALNEHADFEQTFMIAALTGYGVPDLQKALAQAVKVGPWVYGEDQITDISQRLLAAEITREHVYDQLHDELPYSIAVETEQWEDFQNGDLKLTQIIFVQRDSQKAIILGKGGAQIRKLGERARHDIGELFERKVHLSLLVRVKENWMDDPERYAFMGLQKR
jgi:GTP-binding protein Era